MPASQSPLERLSSRSSMAGISLNVVFLGIVSFLTDVSSEMTLTVLPLFLANSLGFSTVAIGVIEGFAETTASLSKIVSGVLSDKFQRRKGLTLLGYSISAVSKPLLYFASQWGMVFAIRLADRVGKGIRTSPRDALIADSSTEDKRGITFGFHRALDTAGAFVGLGLAGTIIFFSQGTALQISQETFQLLVLVAAVPGVLGVLVLAVLVKDIKAASSAKVASSAKEAFGGKFKLFLCIVVLFSLGNSSDAFLALRSQNVGLSAFEVVLALIIFNIVYAVGATPLGALADRVGKRKVLVSGWLCYAAVYFGFALVAAAWMVWFLWFLYGVYYAAADGVARAFAADFVPAEQRGAAYGVYHAAVGITALPASLLAGLLWQGLGNWQGFGPAAPFFFGGSLAMVAAVLFMLCLKPATGNINLR